jgi:hypothetical protein
MRDNRVDFGHRVRYYKFKILFTILVPGPTTAAGAGIEVITKVDQPHLAFMPKAL